MNLQITVQIKYTVESSVSLSSWYNFFKHVLFYYYYLNILMYFLCIKDLTLLNINYLQKLQHFEINVLILEIRFMDIYLFIK